MRERSDVLFLYKDTKGFMFLLSPELTMEYYYFTTIEWTDSPDNEVGQEILVRKDRCIAKLEVTPLLEKLYGE